MTIRPAASVARSRKTAAAGCRSSIPRLPTTLRYLKVEPSTTTATPISIWSVILLATIARLDRIRGAARSPTTIPLRRRSAMTTSPTTRPPGGAGKTCTSMRARITGSITTRSTQGRRPKVEPSTRSVRSRPTARRYRQHGDLSGRRHLGGRRRCDVTRQCHDHKNSAVQGGGIYFSESEPTDLINDTIYGNTASGGAGSGGGLDVTSNFAALTVGAQNTIVANNTGGNCGDGGSPSVSPGTDGGHNLASDLSCFHNTGAVGTRSA